MSTETRFVLVTRINCFLFSIVRVKCKISHLIYQLLFLRGVAKKFPGGSIWPREAAFNVVSCKCRAFDRFLLQFEERKTILRVD